jgi:phosphonate transport system substrate-binding protein
MEPTISRRLFLISLFLSSCKAVTSIGKEQLTIGTLSYGKGEETLDRIDRLRRYLEESLRSRVQLEPAFNENKALERIKSQAWSLVFAPPGLAAIAMSEHQYSPLLPLTGINNLRSVLAVKKDSPYQDIQSLTGKKLAIGQPGSATGYYFPIFNLYGLTLSELILSATPQTILENVATGKADVGALSLQEFNTYKSQIQGAQLRLLLTDTHNVPTGVVMISPTIERNLQETISQTLKDTPSAIAQEAGFIPTGNIPDYKYMISVVKRVRAIFPADRVESSSLLAQKPVRLFRGLQGNNEPKSGDTEKEIKN